MSFWFELMFVLIIKNSNQPICIRGAQYRCCFRKNIVLTFTIRRLLFSAVTTQTRYQLRQHRPPGPQNVHRPQLPRTLVTGHSPSGHLQWPPLFLVLLRKRGWNTHSNAHVRERWLGNGEKWWFDAEAGILAEKSCDGPGGAGVCDGWGEECFGCWWGASWDVGDG